MDHVTLENELRNRMKKRWIIETVISAVFLIIAVAFTVAYENSLVVEEKDWGFVTHKAVTYNTDLTWGILVGWLGFVPSMIFLIGDRLFCKLVTHEVGGYYLTLYRGMHHNNLYVNGECKDSSSGYYLETTLPDRTKVTVSLGKWSAHISFSNGHPSIDV